MARKSDPRNNYIPKDYTDLYQYYIQGDGSLCSKLIRSMMPYADDDERETLAHDVFARLLEKDVLVTGGSSRSERAQALGKSGVFDPTKANFGGVIFFVTRTIVGNHLGRKSRNPLTGLKGGTLSTNEPEEGEFEPGAYSLTRLFGSPAPNYEDQLDARAALSELFDWAKAFYERPRHKRDESLYPLLQMVAEERDPKECAAELGVTPSTIGNWMIVLRDQLRTITQPA